MLVELNSCEVRDLIRILNQAYIDVNQKYYEMNEEPLYSYDKEKREAKKKERHQCIVDSGMYLKHYHYWHEILVRMRNLSYPNLTYLETIDIDPNELHQIRILLHDLLLEPTKSLDILELSSAYRYWIRVSEIVTKGNIYGNRG